jgi:hypothetical protein
MYHVLVPKYAPSLVWSFVQLFTASFRHSTVMGNGVGTLYITAVAVLKTVDPSIVQLLATDHAEGPVLRLADPNSTFPTSLK